jgi:hypothetical protein
MEATAAITKQDIEAIRLIIANQTGRAEQTIIDTLCRLRNPGHSETRKIVHFTAPLILAQGCPYGVIPLNDGEADEIARELLKLAKPA